MVCLGSTDVVQSFAANDVASSNYHSNLELGIVRLGLVQTALGSIVVLTTSTMNRVMVVELALPDDNPVEQAAAIAAPSRHGGIIAPPTVVCETNQPVQRPADATEKGSGEIGARESTSGMG